MWYAITEQTSIGWRQFMCGKISLQWTARQERFMQRTNSKKSSFIWSVELISRLWKIAWSIWNFRCDYAYSPESQWEIQFQKSRHEKIRDEFNRGPDGASGHDRRWWEMDLNKLLQQNPYIQEMWLISVDVVRQKIKRKKTELANQRFIMYRWLHPT